MDALSPLILASASPRRQELLAQIGVRFTCEPADIDESPHRAELPKEYVARVARAKGACVAQRHGAGVPVLAADTTVMIDDDVLGKPVDQFDALAMLARLSGRTHTVLSAVSLHLNGEVVSQTVATQVQFIVLARPLCEAYLATDEPWDKAGAYAIQGLGASFVRSIEGSYSNVVGLPLSETWQMLREAGIPTWLESSCE